MSKSVFPWLPVGFPVKPTVQTRRLLGSGPGAGEPEYQIVDTQDRAHVCILLDATKASSAAVQAATGLRENPFAMVQFGRKRVLVGVYPVDLAPVRIGDLPEYQGFLVAPQLNVLADRLMEIQDSSWVESVFLPQDEQCIPFGSKDTGESRRVLGVRLLTGGVAEPFLSPRQIRTINPWLQEDEVVEFFRRIGVQSSAVQSPREVSMRSPEEFVLPGHPDIEKLFRDKIIDYYFRREQYDSMGVSPPNGILMKGPTGSGKTYAAHKLVEFLGWPLIEINIGEQGSSFMHRTSANIRREFEKAARKAPSVIFLDELDAIGMSREADVGGHRAEEVSELLRQLDSIGEKHVVVLAATNFPDRVDDALKRRGRFDISVEVPYPDADGILSVLEDCLKKRPCAAGIDLRTIAKKMERSPLADVESLVNDAAKIAVQSKRKQIDAESLSRAARGFEQKLDPDKYIL